MFFKSNSDEHITCSVVTAGPILFILDINVYVFYAHCYQKAIPSFDSFY
jgi:hypothetical protein